MRTERGQEIRGRPGEGLFGGRLELEDPGAQHVVPCHPSPNARGHGAEILTDDDRTGAVRLEGNQGMELLGPVGHVGAVGCVAPVRDHVHPLEPHDVVDTEAIGVQEGPSQRSREEAVSVLSYALRMKGAEPPALASGKEAIGWGSPLHARDEGLR